MKMFGQSYDVYTCSCCEEPIVLLLYSKTVTTYMHSQIICHQWFLMHHNHTNTNNNNSRYDFIISIHFKQNIFQVNVKRKSNKTTLSCFHFITKSTILKHVIT